MDGRIEHKRADGVKVEKNLPFPTHKEAFLALIDMLTTGEGKVIDSMDAVSYTHLSNHLLWPRTEKTGHHRQDRVDWYRSAVHCHLMRLFPAQCVRLSRLSQLFMLKIITVRARLPDSVPFPDKNKYPLQTQGISGI